MLVAGPHYISRVAERLLATKSLADLSETEFLELFRSYNAVGATVATEFASRVAVDLYPDSLEIARIRSNVVLLSNPLEVSRSELHQRSERSTQHAHFYALALADHLMQLAWGSDEEFLGHEPEDFGLLDEAAAILRAPKVCEYYESNLQLEGLYGRARRPFLFLDWFDPVFRFPRYKAFSEA